MFSGKINWTSFCQTLQIGTFYVCNFICSCIIIELSQYFLDRYYIFPVLCLNPKPLFAFPNALLVWHSETYERMTLWIGCSFTKNKYSIHLNDLKNLRNVCSKSLVYLVWSQHFFRCTSNDKSKPFFALLSF